MRLTIDRMHDIMVDSDTVAVYTTFMSDSDGQWTIDRLAQAAGTSVRTIRFYISEGILPAPVGRGRMACYSREHMDRLELIRRLVAQRVPLAEIRSRIRSLSGTELRAILMETRDKQGNEASARDRSPKEYISFLLARASFGHDFEKSDYDRRVYPEQGTPADLIVTEESVAPYRTGSPDDADRFRPSSWMRYKLSPSIELHVLNTLGDRERDLVGRILRTCPERGGENHGHE